MKSNGNYSRRELLGGIIAAGAVQGLGGCRLAGRADAFDENLTVCLSDIHVAHENPRNRKETLQPTYQNPYFERTVNRVLAMRPLPRRVVIFGDIALWYGWDRDYEVSKPGVDRLKAAGIDVTLTTGNHDHRVPMLSCYADVVQKSPVPGRIVSTVDLGDADLLLLDSLDENPEGEGSKNGVAGVLDKAQQEWLMETGRAAKRPFLVGAHHPIKELKVGEKPLVAALCAFPGFAGYIHGHDHRWYQLWHHVGYSDRKVQRSACLPSTGWWGDIGFATLRTFPDRAELALVEDDFFFPKPLEPGETRPREWDDILAANYGAVCVFRFQT